MTRNAAWASRSRSGSEATSAACDAQVALDRRRLDRDRLERALAADAAGRGRVEAPPQPLRVEAGGLDVDGVRGQVGRRATRPRAQPLRDAEAERELLVVPRRPHRHRDRAAVDADLERLLDGDPVARRPRPGRGGRSTRATEYGGASTRGTYTRPDGARRRVLRPRPHAPAPLEHARARRLVPRVRRDRPRRPRQGGVLAAPVRRPRRERRDGAQGGRGRADAPEGVHAGADARARRRGDGGRAAAARLRRADAACSSGIASAASRSTSSRRRSRRSSTRSPPTSASTARSGRSARSRTAPTPAARSARSTARTRPAALVELAEREGLDLAASTAYSDSHTDLPFLEAVGNPVAVNPDRALAQVAAERGWEVLTFSERLHPAAPRRVPPVAVALPLVRRRRRSGPSGAVRPDEARARLAALGYAPDQVEALFAHFDEAERRGKHGHGYSRIEWLERELRDRIDPSTPAGTDRGGRRVRALARPRRARLPHAGRGRARHARRRRRPERGSSSARRRSRPGCSATTSRRLADAGLVAAADGDLAAAPRAARRRPGARRHEPARDRDPELGRGRRSSSTSRPRRRRGATCCAAPHRPRTCPVRRRAGAQGVRARARPRPARRGADAGGRLRRGAARRAAGSGPCAGAQRSSRGCQAPGDGPVSEPEGPSNRLLLVSSRPWGSAGRP